MNGSQVDLQGKFVDFQGGHFGLRFLVNGSVIVSADFVNLQGASRLSNCAKLRASP